MPNDPRAGKLISVVSDFAAGNFSRTDLLVPSERHDDFDSVTYAIRMLGEHWRTKDVEPSDFDHLFNALPCLGFLLAVDSTIRRANRVACQLLGRRSGHLRGTHIGKLVEGWPDLAPDKFARHFPSRETITLFGALKEGRGPRIPLQLDITRTSARGNRPEFLLLAWDRSIVAIRDLLNRAALAATDQASQLRLQLAAKILDRQGDLRSLTPATQPPNPAIAKYHLDAIDLEHLEYISQGKTSKEIAPLMKLAFRTVEGRKATLIEKLNATKDTNLIRRAFELGLLTVHPTASRS
jgi:DNA-binding CsgD family transcriptional regulator/PAS domain-containing protein